MKLHEIIELNENDNQSILIEKLVPYKKSLLVYYTDLFRRPPLLMVTEVFNACQYGKIVSESDFYDAVCAYLNVDYISTDETDADFDEEIFAQYETINFNSIPLDKL